MKDRDIERWSAAWREGTPPTADLARMAQRERRLLTAWIAFDWLVGAALLCFAAWLWLAIGTPVMGFTAIGIALLTIAVLAFSIVNWRGSLTGNRSSAADFLSHARQRSQARMRYIRFGWRVLAADLVVIAGAVALEMRDEGAARIPGMLVSLALATAAAAGVLWWWGRRERRRAKRLATLQAAMDAGGENGHG